MTNTWWKDIFNETYAAAFDRFYDARKTDAELAFAKKHLRLRRGADVLDVPCGQGRHVAKLAALDYRVTGRDYSPALVRLAKQHLRGLSLTADVRRGDMRCLNFKNCFDAVLVLGNSFGYFSDGDNGKVIAGLARALRPDGRLLLDLSNAAGLMRNPLGASTFDFPGGYVKTNNHSFDPATMRLSIRWEIKAEGKEASADGSLRLYTAPEITSLLKANSLKVKAIYGDYQSGKFTIDSPRLIVIAQK